MKQLSIIAPVYALLLAGCVPHVVVLADGIHTKVIDSETKQPLRGAFAYVLHNNARPATPDVFALARSNEQGILKLEPKTKLNFSPFLGENLINQSLWICKEGYQPYLVGMRSGWNADYSPSRIYKFAVVGLSKSSISSNSELLRFSVFALKFEPGPSRCKLNCN